jgi:hypothetical protein
MQQENKKINHLLKNSLSIATIVLLSGASVTIAAITFSNTSITGDSSFNAITGATSTTIDLGSGSTLSLQTTNNGPILTGTGLFSVGGAFNTTGTATFANTILASGNLLFAAGLGIDSSVAGTLLIGNSTTTGITIGRSGQTVSFPGNASTTGTATFLSALTQSGGTASLATTTVGGSLTINSGAPILKHLSATSSITFGVIASSSCATATMTVTGANAGDNVYAAPTPVASGIETVSASWSAYASSTSLIAIKACNPTITNTASVAAEVWRADVWQH